MLALEQVDIKYIYMICNWRTYGILKFGVGESRSLQERERVVKKKEESERMLRQTVWWVSLKFEGNVVFKGKLVK